MAFDTEATLGIVPDRNREPRTQRWRPAGVELLLALQNAHDNLGRWPKSPSERSPPLLSSELVLAVRFNCYSGDLDRGPYASLIQTQVQNHTPWSG
jgi:hypothetical protein